MRFSIVSTNGRERKMVNRGLNRKSWKDWAPPPPAKPLDKFQRETAVVPARNKIQDMASVISKG